MLKPGQVIFAVNSSGRVFSLATSEATWRELTYQGVEFKRVSASGNVVWAVGGDHQVYVLVYGIEVPILVKEVTYENHRWNPVDGFSNKLLPTDRPEFSTVDGRQERCRESVRLPSLAWAWEGEWHLETEFKGHSLGWGAGPMP